MRVLFLTNASCPEGRFGEGATAELSDAQALEFERQHAVKILETPIAINAAAAESAPVATPTIVEGANDAPGEPTVQVSATDGAHAETQLG